LRSDYGQGGGREIGITTTLDPVTVLSVSGYIDAATFPQLVREADEALSTGHVRLVLDLSGVDYQ
jgi:anti-anti-sigma regulatory factor